MVWSCDEVRKRQSEKEFIGNEDSGLTWNVVESVPVSQDIKTQTGAFREHLDAYRETLIANKIHQNMGYIAQDDVTKSLSVQFVDVFEVCEANKHQATLFISLLINHPGPPSSHQTLHHNAPRPHPELNLAQQFYSPEAYGLERYDQFRTHWSASAL